MFLKVLEEPLNFVFWLTHCELFL